MITLNSGGNFQKTMIVPPSMLFSTNPALYIGESPGKGRGVFSKEPIGYGTIFEQCPIQLFTVQDLEHLSKTYLANYYFRSPTATLALRENVCILAAGFLPFGYGSMYNHAQFPNAKMKVDLSAQVAYMIAHQDIAPHEEIVHNFLGRPGLSHPLFDNHEIVAFLAAPNSK